jgi:hypothetical protein
VISAWTREPETIRSMEQAQCEAEEKMTAFKIGPMVGRGEGVLKLLRRVMLVLLIVDFLALATLGEDQPVVQSITSDGKNVLENGLIRLIFNQQTGQFEAYGLHGEVIRLFQAGPAWQINDKKLGIHETTKRVTREQDFEDKIGLGKKLIVNYEFKEGPGFRYELSLYQGKPWISLTAFLPKGDYRLQDVSLLQGKVRVPRAFTTRVYYNAGTAGLNPGVWPMGINRWSSAALSVLYQPEVEDAIGLGFYSFFRASTSVASQYLSANEIGVDAAAHYYGYRPQAGELKSESLLLNFGNNPLAVLEQWADATVKVVQPQFDHDTRTGRVNEWYTYGDETTEDNILTMAKELRDSVLPGYGITMISTGEWQKQHLDAGDLANVYGMGEDQEDPILLPHGLTWLFNQIRSYGLQPIFGANFSYAGSESSIGKKHVPWVMWSDKSHLDWGYPIDFTDPEAQKWLYNLAHRTIDFKARAWVDDVSGGPTKGPLHDPTKVMRFEDMREGLKTIRQAIGPNVLMDHYAGGSIFTYLGLGDRVKVTDDTLAIGDFEGLKRMARQLSTNYMLHQRFWINNPDALFVGGRVYVRDPNSGPIAPDPAIRDEVRMRLQYQIASGGPVTIGEDIADFDPDRMHLLTLVLPPYGQAARPLDLFTHTTPEIYDLAVKTDWDHWHVLMLQNWNEEDQKYHIRFSQLGLDENRSRVVFSFWDQMFLGEFRGGSDLAVRAHRGECYMIRETPEHPWVLSTDLHLTQGGVELSGVKYDAASSRLEGEASRHVGAKGHIVIYVPQGYKIQSASAVYHSQLQPSGAQVVFLETNFDQKTILWWLKF